MVERVVDTDEAAGSIPVVPIGELNMSYEKSLWRVSFGGYWWRMDLTITADRVHKIDTSILIADGVQIDVGEPIEEIKKIEG